MTKEIGMRKFLRIMIKTVVFCVLMLAASLGICLAAGLAGIPEDDRQTCEVPVVYVVQPQEQSLPEEETETVNENPDSEEKEEAEPEEEPVTLLFGGDLFLTELLQSKYQQKGIQAAVSEKLLETVRAADIFMVNEEFPFGTTGEPAADKQYTFRINPEYVSVLTEMGVDIVTLANNHMLDFGRQPLTETLQTLDSAGIVHVGAGENLDDAKALKTFEAGGKTIGFLGASRVIPEYSWNASAGQSGLFTTYDSAALVEQIQKAEEICDFTVVYVHWGIERSTQPEEYQKSLARQYIDAGADAVIGAHPHVLQGIEYYQGKPVFYSLGNFIFSNSTYQTMLVELTLDGEQTDVRLLPCVSEANQMQFLEESGHAAFYQNLENLSFGVSIGSDGRINR